MSKIDVETLDNGLKIYFYEDKRKHTTNVNFVTYIHSSLSFDAASFNNCVNVLY